MFKGSDGHPLEEAVQTAVVDDVVPGDDDDNGDDDDDDDDDDDNDDDHLAGSDLRASLLGPQAGGKVPQHGQDAPRVFPLL